jgi:nucleoside-diphosphate-sugar epimerase
MPTGSQAPTLNTKRTETEPVPICAVTGASGYVGSIVVEALRAAGMEVVVLGRPTAARAVDGRARLFRLGEPVEPKLWTGVSILVHCAYDFSVRSWSEIQRVNVRGSLQLFESARDAGVKRLIFISSMSSFPGCRSLYGRAKLAVERRANELGLIIVRPGLVYGPRPGGMAGALRRVIRRMPVLPLVGRGDQALYPLHEEDLGQLIVHLCICAKPTVGVPIVAASERSCSFRHLLESLARKEGKTVHFIPVPAPLLWGALKCLEALGVQTRLHSDSLVGFMNQDRHPDFTATKGTGVMFRDFGTG